MPDEYAAGRSAPAETASLPGTPQGHDSLPEGHWWGCSQPERPPERINGQGLTHWKRGCHACFLSWRTAASLPRQTFLFHNHENEPPKALYPERQTEREVYEWFMQLGEQVGQ
jgi:hypothetical protein